MDEVKNNISYLKLLSMTGLCKMRPAFYTSPTCILHKPLLGRIGPNFSLLCMSRETNNHALSYFIKFHILTQRGVFCPTKSTKTYGLRSHHVTLKTRVSGFASRKWSTKPKPQKRIVLRHPG
jgi:hypothetical protein